MNSLSISRLQRIVACSKNVLAFTYIKQRSLVILFELRTFNQRVKPVPVVLAIAHILGNVGCQFVVIVSHKAVTDRRLIATHVNLLDAQLTAVLVAVTR